MSESVAQAVAARKVRRQLDRAVVRFAGDSGDGMQVTGEQFATEAAWAGADLATLPNFPAEIRAPAGTLFGVSSYQLQFGSRRIYTPGDRLDCLVAMNPAALKVHLGDLKEGGLLIVNTATFEKKNLDRAGYQSSPLDDSALESRYRLHRVDITRLTMEALEGLALNVKEKERCKNFSALGLVSWVYDRPIEPTVKWIQKRFAKNAAIAEANNRALKTPHWTPKQSEKPPSKEVPLTILWVFEASLASSSHSAALPTRLKCPKGPRPFSKASTGTVPWCGLSRVLHRDASNSFPQG